MNKTVCIVSKKIIKIFFLISIFCVLLDSSIFELSKVVDICYIFLLEFSYFVPVIFAITINKIVEKKSHMKERSIKIIKILFYIFSLAYIIWSLYIAFIMRVVMLTFGQEW